MHSTRSVCVCILHTGKDLKPLEETLSSVMGQTFEGVLDVVILDTDPAHGESTLVPTINEEWDGLPNRLYTVIKCNPALPGGHTLSILQTWLGTEASYLCYIQGGNLIPPGRISSQVDYMQGFNLSACYGNVVSITEPEVYGLGDGRYLLKAKEFSPDMIGLSCFDVQTMLISKEKFMAGGGFDHAICAGYRPSAYLTAFSAVSGRIKHLDTVLLEKRVEDVLRESRGGIDTSTGAEMWKRIRFDSFVLKTRDFYIRRGEEDWV